MVHTSYPPKAATGGAPKRLRLSFVANGNRAQITYWATVLGAVCALAALAVSACQLRQAAESLQVQQTFTIIDDAHRIEAMLLRDDALAELIRTNSGTPDQRRKATALLSEYNASLIKFSLLQDKRAADQAFVDLFKKDFCRWYEREFFRAWWEGRKRTEPFYKISPSYRSLEDKC
jgi:hypothetical protein